MEIFFEYFRKGWHIFDNVSVRLVFLLQVFPLLMHAQALSRFICDTAYSQMLLVNFDQCLIIDLILLKNLQHLFMLRHIEVGGIDNLLHIHIIFALTDIFIFDLLVLDIPSLCQFLSQFSYLLSELFEILSHILIYFYLHFKYLCSLCKH